MSYYAITLDGTASCSNFSHIRSTNHCDNVLSFAGAFVMHAVNNHKSQTHVDKHNQAITNDTTLFTSLRVPVIPD